MHLLADAVETYEINHLARWWEWEAASEGRRQLTWSAGPRSLRAHANLDAELSDEQIAAVEIEGERHHVMTRDEWSLIVHRKEEAHLLATIEHFGTQGFLCHLAYILQLQSGDHTISRRHFEY